MLFQKHLGNFLIFIRPQIWRLSPFLAQEPLFFSTILDKHTLFITKSHNTGSILCNWAGYRNVLECDRMSRDVDYALLKSLKKESLIGPAGNTVTENMDILEFWFKTSLATSLKSFKRKIPTSVKQKDRTNDPQNINSLAFLFCSWRYTRLVSWIVECVFLSHVSMIFHFF